MKITRHSIQKTIKSIYKTPNKSNGKKSLQKRISNQNKNVIEKRDSVLHNSNHGEKKA